MRFRVLPSVLTLVLVSAVLVLALGLWRRSALIVYALRGPLNTTAISPPPEPIAGETGIPAAVAQASAQVEPTFTPTPAPPTATPQPTPTPPPTPTPTPLPFDPPPATALLTGMRHEWQTWNNCGPATIAMNLSYFGSAIDQAQAGAVLRLSADDKNVSPYELVEYAQQQGYVSQRLVAGSTDLARTLIANGIPVLVETWHEDGPNDGMGHYRLLVGYDDASQTWTVFDSYDRTNLIAAEPYAGLRFSYAEMDGLWKVFNRAFVLAYPPDRAARVDAILAAFGLSAETMQQAALAEAQAELAANPGDVYAWFNQGSSLAALQRYDEAAAAFDQASAIGLPWRMLWYQFGPFEAYLAVGRAQDVVALADKVNAVTTSIEEIHYWRGRGLEALGDSAGAAQAFRTALELNPKFAPAQQALAGVNAS